MRVKTTYRIAGYMMFVVYVVMLVGSCQEPPYGMDASPVYLVVEQGALQTGEEAYGKSVDVYTPSVKEKVTDDYFDLLIGSRYKDSEISSPFADVILEQYTVSYYRLDGNPLVPDPFTVQCHILVPAGDQNRVGTLVMRREAKLKTPFYELRFGGGEGKIFMNAVIQFWGEDLMGNKVTLQHPYNLVLDVSDN